MELFHSCYEITSQMFSEHFDDIFWIIITGVIMNEYLDAWPQ